MSSESYESISVITSSLRHYHDITRSVLRQKCKCTNVIFIGIAGGLAEQTSDVWSDVIKRNNEAIVWFDDDPLREAVEVAK